MKKGWKIEKLGNVCKFVRGPFGGSLKKSCFKQSGNAVYEQQHAIYNQFNEIRYFIDDEKFDEMKRFELQPGDLIMSCSGTMGKVAIVPKGIKKGIINQALLKLTTSPNLDVDYLNFWMDSNNFQESLAKSTVGAAIKNVASVKILKEIEIPIPPLAEQKQIVAKLDKAFAAIDKAEANTKQNIANAKELFQSRLDEIFTIGANSKGWVTKKLGDVCENLDSKRKPITKSKRDKGLIPYYGASGIVDYVKDYIFDTEILLVSEDGANLLTRTYPIAFSVSGKCWVNNHAHVLKFDNKINQIFIERYLNSISLEPFVSGMAQPKLNQRKLNSIEVPFPNNKTQEKIVKELDKLREATDKLVANYEKKLSDMAELRKSLLEQAFLGNLT